jgi:hypothetical protein
MLTACVIFILFSSISYAGGYPELDKYYPLAIGNKWVYSIGTIGLKQESVKFFDNDLNAYVVESNNQISGKFFTAIQKLGDRVSAISSMSNSLEYKTIFPPHVIMVSPLKIGSKWEYNDGNDYKQQFKVIGFVNMSVKAGKFKKVLKIEKYTMNTKDRSKDWGKSFLYYAPFVGLIKEEFPVNGNIEVILELVDYNFND